MDLVKTLMKQMMIFNNFLKVYLYDFNINKLLRVLFHIYDKCHDHNKLKKIHVKYLYFKM